MAIADTTDVPLPVGSILGTRVLRTEDPGFLTTGAVYTDDLVDERLTGAVHATFVRSPVAHARIESIDVSGAMDMPGVVAVLTADELGAPDQRPMMPMYPKPMMQPLLARDVVRYVGEPVAVVLTEEAYQGEDAAELVAVDYEPLPVVVDPRDALADEVLLFPEAGTNLCFANPVAAAQAAGGEDLAAAEDVTDDGPAAAADAFAELRGGRLAGGPQPARRRGAAGGARRRCRVGRRRPADDLAAQPGGAGQQAVGARHAAPRRRLRAGDHPGRRRAFGGKFGADVEHAVVALAARHVGRPARWVETRSENMVAMTHGRAQVQTVTIGGDRDGTIRAYRLHVLQDSGAYPKFGALLPSLTVLMAPGVYDIPVLETSFQSVVTNTTPVGAYRGAGRPEATAAIERAVDLFAAEIGMDPAEVRRKNLIAGRSPSRGRSKGGALYDSGDYAATPWTRCSRRPTTPRCAPSRRPGASGATSASSASGCRCTWRSPAAARSPASRRRTRWSRCTPTGRRRSSPARRRTARATRRCGRCWPASSSASPSTGSRSSGATPTWSPRAAARAARAACSRAAPRSARPPRS